MGHTVETRARDLAKRKALRKEWLQEHGPCVECNSWEDLELDHKDPSTKISHSVWSWSIERRLKELEKCQVLCRECHLNKTKVDLSILNMGKYTGANCGTSKYTEVQIQQVWNLKAQGFTHAQISFTLGMPRGTIGRICSPNGTWKYLNPKTSNMEG